MDSELVIGTTGKSHEGLVMSKSSTKPASLEKAFIVPPSFKMDARATASHPLPAGCALALDIQRAREALD
ncbi:hypothetical protein AMTRI_Chr13g85350 [Amborella trichopoda]